MKRKPTNTLIVTNIPDPLYDDPQPLIKYLTQQQQHMMELTVLANFKRFLIRCDSPDIATEIKCTLENSPRFNAFNITYSLKDNHGGPVYLEIPKELEKKRFLISPPGSPHAEWDSWDKVEEGPNELNIHDYLWEKLGKLSDDEGEGEDEERGDVDMDKENGGAKKEVPTIVLDPIE
ncbi:Calcipressin-like protein [Candida viswanathii]|uniref:Calcipressin-like protein n=1 Tax=Candida viswanathii TaxID=5486 RepID=A0A367XWK8_9ASCO|nr:Calcipressin-like protein [Candida viswanathii]